MGIYDREYYQEDALRAVRPWDNRSMVTLLIFANFAFFIADYLVTPRTHGFARQMILQPTDLTQPLYWWRFVSYGFAHADIWHILFNMVSLYFLGRSVEGKYGKWEFFRFYMIALVACSLTWAIVRQATQMPGGVLGASGAVTAVSMMFVFSFPRATLMLYGVIPVKAWVVGILIVVGNLLGNQDKDNVAYDVHLYGVAFAAMYFFLGWNFTSLGNFVGGISTKAKASRRGLKVHAPRDEPTAKEEAESDRILDKIVKEGKDSLTRRERAFMERYSEKVRKRRARG